MPEKILVVDDEKALQETLAYNLKDQGYQVFTAGDGDTAIKKALEEKPDLIILDIMLPGMDGFEVCRIIRQQMNVPILMLTARDDEIDRVVGLEVGADDYLTKPFSLRELMARIKAMLRRVRLIKQETSEDTGAIPKKKGMSFGNLEIDQIRHEIRLDEKPLTLKPKEYELMEFLAEHHRQALSRDLILERVWGWQYTGDSRTVDVHIRWLREKIESDPTHPTRIITVRGAGYMFEG